MTGSRRVDREYVRLRLSGLASLPAAAESGGGQSSPGISTLAATNLFAATVASGEDGAASTPSAVAADTLVAVTVAKAPGIPAAVLVGLVDEGAGPRVILTRRRKDLSSHPGEISLPGGRLERQDEGPEAAALREAEEEVGLSPERVELLGRLPPYRTITDYCVQPVVGWITGPIELRPDPREVAEVFLVPLSFILEPANHRQGSLVRDGKRRTYYELCYEGRRIWGATAGILVGLAHILNVGQGKDL